MMHFKQLFRLCYCIVFLVTAMVFLATNGYANPEENKQEQVQPEASKPELTLPVPNLPKWQGSIMFDINSLNNIRQELINYRVLIEQINSGLIPPKDEAIPSPNSANPLENQAPIEVKAINYYLGSILKIPNKTASIWLNGERLTEKGNDKIQIITVTDDKATLEISEPNLDSIAPNWKEKSIKQVSGKHLLPNDITVDENKKTVRFSLKTNQTFILRTMDIVEGRILTASEIKPVAPSQQNVQEDPFKEPETTANPEQQTAPQPVPHPEQPVVNPQNQ